MGFTNSTSNEKVVLYYAELTQKEVCAFETGPGHVLSSSLRASVVASGVCGPPLAGTAGPVPPVVITPPPGPPP
jgi:hypothetical protein